MAGKTKRVGGAGAMAIPERNDELVSGADNGFIADQRSTTAKAGVTGRHQEKETL